MKSMDIFSVGGSWRDFISTAKRGERGPGVPVELPCFWGDASGISRP